jgi:DNA-binding GntR family transcriptional regulator
MTSPIAAASRAKLGAEVARWLRDELMAGSYEPAQRMGVEDLAAQLGVSTMPVREALIMLSNEGLLEGLPRRGFRVAPIALQDIKDVFEVHAFLAGELADRAAISLRAEDLEELRAIDDQIRELSGTPGTYNQIEEANFNFHRIINRAPEATRLEWFLRAATRFVPRRFYEAVPGWIEETITQHPAILEALEARDSQKSRDLMVEHVAEAGRLVIAHLEAEGWGTRPRPE